MAVEAREEAKAMLSREVFSPPLAGSRNPEAPRFAARNRARFVNDHVDVALGQLVSGAHAGDPSTQDDDLHRAPFSLQSMRTVPSLSQRAVRAPVRQLLPQSGGLEGRGAGRVLLDPPNPSVLEADDAEKPVVNPGSGIAPL